MRVGIATDLAAASGSSASASNGSARAES